MLLDACMLRRDERSGALIGAGGTWRSDWARARRLLACVRTETTPDRI